VHGGLLARRDLPAHMAALQAHGIDTIDLLVVNLYPFEATVAKPGCTLEDAIENIDIGGPAMVRSAAKNWKDVAVLTDASQYAGVLAELQGRGKVSEKTKFALSVAAFNRISQYDGAISDYLSAHPGRRQPRAVPGPVANGRFVKLQDLRYGENPHQQAAFTATCTRRRARWSRQAAAGQGAELQQHRRRRCRLGMRQELRHAGLRDRQARQPLWRGRGRHALEAYSQGLQDRPDLGLRRHHRAQPHAGRRLPQATSASSSSRC
jgi:hypothetical protein